MNERAIATGLLLLSCVTMCAGCDEKKEASPPVPAAETPATTTASAAPAASASPAAASASAAPATPPDAIAAQHVLVAWKGAKNAPRSVTRSKADAQKRAEEVSAKAKGGADFSALVAEYTDDEGTKDRRGSLGKFTRSKMTPAFADAAFALGVDEVSAPVETPFGYHVIKRNQ